MSWLEQLRKTFIASGHYEWIIEGFLNTIKITLGALAIGVVIGSAVAVAKFFSEGAPSMRWVSVLCDFYVTVIRGIPVVVLLFIFFFVVMIGADGVTVAILTFGINSGAYMAEVVRSGINAVDTGQMEAGRSLGLSKMQAMRKIVFPQAIRNILPAIGNEMIALLKETSVAGYVAVVDLTRAGNLVRNNTFDAINPLLLVALVYLVLVVGLTRLLKVFERKLAKNEDRIRKRDLH